MPGGWGGSQPPAPLPPPGLHFPAPPRRGRRSAGGPAQAEARSRAGAGWARHGSVGLGTARHGSVRPGEDAGGAVEAALAPPGFRGRVKGRPRRRHHEEAIQPHAAARQPDRGQVEKRLELVKQVSHSTHKKLTACLQGQQGVDADKRSKKLPLTTLAQCLMEGSAVLGDDSLLGKMLRLCGEAEDKLAQELIQFELQVERDVIEPLFVLAEVEIPNIQKQRKHLAKLVL
uniref:BAR domain-containing protein n=1 Tax=Cairina moschata TaxID=8855 RepID=A0A8C3BWI6_CAIMO